MEKLRSVLYGRVSTEEQGKNGTSLRGQFSGNTAKSREINAEVVATFEDEDSGGFYLTRKGLQAALECVESGQANVFIVKDFVRLTRNDRSEQASILERIKKAKAKLVFWDAVHEDSALGEFSLNVQGDFAILEKRVIRERTTAGRKRRAFEGQMPSRTHAPFGFIIPKKDDVIRGTYTHDQLGKYLLHPEHSLIVKEVFERVAAGQSVNSVTTWLQESGVQTVAGGKFWRQSNLRCILSNPAYYGSAAFGRSRTVTDESRVLQGFKRRSFEVDVPEEDWVRIPCPEIVTKELWDECQRRIKENRERLSTRVTRRQLLTGMLRCPKCQRVMTGRAHAKGMVSHYKCKEASPSTNSKGFACWNKHINVKNIEPLILEAVKVAACNPGAVEGAYDAYRESLTNTFSEQEYQQLKKELSDLNGEEVNLVKAQVKGIAAGANTAVYESMLHDVALKRTSLQTRLDKIEKTRESSQAVIGKAEVIEKAVADVVKVLDADEDLVTTPEKNSLLQQIIDHIYPGEDGLKFTVTFKTFDAVTRLVVTVEAGKEVGLSVNSLN